jgi:hypothetical protein
MHKWIQRPGKNPCCTLIMQSQPPIFSILTILLNFGSDFEPNRLEKCAQKKWALVGRVGVGTGSQGRMGGVLGKE